MKIILQLFLILILVLSCKNEPKKQSNTPIEPKVQAQPEAPKPIVEEAPKEVDTSNMVFFEGGTITFGSDQGLPNEQPLFEKTIEPFYLDKNLVTVAEFRKFIEETGYKTDADKFGDSGVYLFGEGRWNLVKGANWMYPLGPTEAKAIDNHPVTHVSWSDASAYAKWVGKRLPTEFEWEYAAKSGKNSSDKYSWGNSLIVDNKYMANVWQGQTSEKDAGLDGYLLTSPVGTFKANAAGLTDMGGNVWQWCANTYESYPDNALQEPKDPDIRSTRGGSFMFDQALDKSFTTTFRGKNSIDTSLFNTGFRCAN
jgi:sulfatase modifying factor 1